MTSSRSAFAVAVWVLIVAAAGLAGYGYIQFKEATSSARPKKEVATLVTTAQAGSTADQNTQTALHKALADDQANLAAEKAKEQVAAGFNAGVGIALDGDPNPSLNSKVALVLQGEVAKTLDPASAAQIANDQVIIAQLKASNATTSAALTATQQQRDQALETVKVTAAQAKVSDDQARLAASQSVALSKQVVDQASKLKVWADNNPTLLARIKHLTYGIAALVALILLIGWGLPLIGKAFPAAAPIVKGIAAVFLPVLHLLHEAEKKVLAEAATLAKTELGKTQAALTTTQATLVQVASGNAPTPPVIASATVSGIAPVVSVT